MTERERFNRLIRDAEKAPDIIKVIMTPEIVKKKNAVKKWWTNPSIWDEMEERY